MNLTSTLLGRILAVALACQSITASADVITDWNKITQDTTKAGGLNSNLGTRIGAIEAIAVYDAVNSIRRFGTPYLYNTPPATPASADAAAAQAARDVLVNYFPAQQSALDAKLAASLSAIPDGPEKVAGLAVGSASAAAIIAARANDGSSPNVGYPGPATPGVGEWRPTPTAFANGINQQWATLTPFLIPSNSVFRPGPPPAVGTVAYSNALAEVEALGSTTSVTRTADQTHIAQFYKQDAELLINEAARLLSAAHGLSLAENALLFVLTDIAIADARIAVWDAKYTYKFWRPVTALNANPDGSVTNGYATWSPLIVTPAHPEYPSGHSGNINAGVEVLKDFFGNRQTLTLSTTTAGEPARTVRSLSQIEIENGRSRIYGGIHYQFSNEEGQAIGNKVAAYVLANGPRFLPSTSSAPAQLKLDLYPGISVTGGVGRSYRIDYSTALAPTNWLPLRFVTLPSTESFLIFDRSSPHSTNRFYRAVEVSNGD